VERVTSAVRPEPSRLGADATAFVYPGQGTQRVGMGAWLQRASDVTRETFSAASEIVGFDIVSLCARGPASALTATERAQPVIFTCNAAAHRLLLESGVTPGLVAGHSVGEFNALHASGILTFEDALRLVMSRAELMSEVRRPGAMGAVMGLGPEDVQQCCDLAAGRGTVVVALLNAPGSTVVSGDVAGVERALEVAKDRGARRVTRLATSNAFHSPLMDEVSQEWEAVVSKLDLSPPRLPIALNTTGALPADAACVRQAVIDQLTKPVRWSDCVATLRAEGAEVIVECGDSKVLSGFARLIDTELRPFSMSDPRAVRALAQLQAAQP